MICSDFSKSWPRIRHVCEDSTAHRHREKTQFWLWHSRSTRARLQDRHDWKLDLHELRSMARNVTRRDGATSDDSATTPANPDLVPHFLLTFRLGRDDGIVHDMALNLQRPHGDPHVHARRIFYPGSCRRTGPNRLGRRRSTPSSHRAGRD